ncbi:hypothetical protein GCM10009727_65480 [Actinomadura napierensis]|uniref:Uncharacterized protein n=1 Tax=Actinomadura napierensis TaxID=267854 RepID=A0ABN3A964_9ACTN
MLCNMAMECPARAAAFAAAQPQRQARMPQVVRPFRQRRSELGPPDRLAVDGRQSIPALAAAADRPQPSHVRPQDGDQFRTGRNGTLHTVRASLEAGDDAA